MKLKNINYIQTHNAILTRFPQSEERAAGKVGLKLLLGLYCLFRLNHFSQTAFTKPLISG
jgi:hypothetical protein